MSNTKRGWKSLLTSYPPGEVEVFEREEAFGDSRPAGSRPTAIARSCRANSTLASWPSRLAWFALALAALSVLVLRSDLLEIVPALATFGAALVLAGLAILCSFGAAVVIFLLRR